MKQIGILSDTHGVLSQPAIDALEGSDLILHAGDIGDPGILQNLRRVAPVHAVRGNMDGGKWATRLPVSDIIDLGRYLFYIIHDYNSLDIDPAGTGIHAIISGHTHRPSIEWKNGLLIFNPGSAAQSRYGGPLSVGRIRTSAASIEPEIIPLMH